MAPPRKNAIEHFTHPGHRLTELDRDTEYVCHICKTPGMGKRYKCDRGCDIYLHEYCGICPKGLSSFVHPHELRLVMQKAQENSQSNHSCNVCSSNVEGLFYRCKECDFDVHPLCTQFPEILNQVLNFGTSSSEKMVMEPLRKSIVEHFTHPLHPLREISFKMPYLCNVCETPGDGKRYRCNQGCDFDSHEYCSTCPKILSVFMHPHKLRLVRNNTQVNSQNDRVCDMCRHSVKGMFYHCSDCDFDVHPLCTQLPEILRNVFISNGNSSARLAMKEMASPSNNTIEHFSHPGHRLMEFTNEVQYLCHVCKTPGDGKGYRCDRRCDIYLHEYCGISPKVLSSYVHLHELRLVMQKAKGNRQSKHACNVCRDKLEGLFYRCTHCNFDVHPLCTQLPQSLRHVLHQTHLLKLEAISSLSLCAVCKGICNSWRYRCGECTFDIHIECVCVVVEYEQPVQYETENFVPQPDSPSAPPLFNAYEQPSDGGYPYDFPHSTHSYSLEQQHQVVKPHSPSPYNLEQQHQVVIPDSPRPYNLEQKVQIARPPSTSLGTKIFALAAKFGVDMASDQISGVVSDEIFGAGLSSFLSS